MYAQPWKDSCMVNSFIQSVLQKKKENIKLKGTPQILQWLFVFQ